MNVTPVARLNVRWRGRPVGATVIGSSAVEAIGAGIATEIECDAEIITTTPHTTDQEGTDDGEATDDHRDEEAGSTA